METIRLGRDVVPHPSKKQRVLMRLYKIPIVSRFVKKRLKRSFGLDDSVTIGPGFYSASSLLKVGMNTGLSDLYIHGTGEVIFGNNCHTSPKVTIVTTTHDFHDFGILKVKPTIIEDHVWTAFGAKILQGVTIGRGAVIGAFSVVRKSIPPYAVVTGNPCKIVGFRLTPEEVVRFEKEHYPEEDRIPLSVLQENYNTYYVARKEEIKNFYAL